MSRRRSDTRRPSVLDLLDPRFYAQEFAYGQPSLEDISLPDLLDFLGEDDDERVKNVTSLLRRSSAEERLQLATIVQRALANVAHE